VLREPLAATYGMVVNLCAHFIALEAALSGAVLSQMPRDVATRSII